MILPTNSLQCTDIARAALGEPQRRSGHELFYRCSRHDDEHPSLQINQIKNVWLCGPCSADGNAWQLAAFLGRLDPNDKASVVAWLKQHGLSHEAPSAVSWRDVAEYDYTDEHGALLFQVVRREPKAFRQRRPDGNGGWHWDLNGTRRVLYRLADALKAEFVLICEGEKDCETARTIGLVATCNSGGAGKWREEYSECLRGKRVGIIADADEPGRKHAQQVAQSIFGKAESLKVFELPGAKDLSEWVEKGGTHLALLELIHKTLEWNAQTGVSAEPPLVTVAVEELLTRQIKPREMLLDPILPEQGLAMLYAYRGIGKTFLALGIGAAVASGAQFLRWTAARARNVLYVDGELPAKTLQERAAMILAGMEQEPSPAALRLITPDFQERPMPDFATLEGQRLLEPHLAGVDLLVLDNLSALCRYGKENEGEGWLPVQEWALSLRRRGMAVLFVHHAGKNKSQRGTSRREDLLDTVITLKHPADYNPSEGLRCEVHFEKTRAMLGDSAKPFEVRLETGTDGRAVWTWRELESAKAERAAQLFADGVSVRDVAEELDISRSAAQRLRAKWVAQAGSGDVSQRPNA